MIALKKIWRFLFFLNFGLTLLFFYPLFFILLQNKKWFPLVMKLKRLWAKFILFNVGLSYEVEYEKKLDKSATYVFCPNHTSYLDVILTYLAIPNYFHYLAKIELAQTPLFGIFFKRNMDIAFDRSSIKASHKAFLKAGADLDNNISIALFPEGTISNSAPVLARFKNGPFKLAIEKQVPIVPITFLNNWKLLPDDLSNGPGHPGKAKVVVHAAIPTSGLTEKDLESLKDKAFQVINNCLSSHSIHYSLNQVSSADQHKIHLAD